MNEPQSIESRWNYNDIVFLSSEEKTKTEEDEKAEKEVMQ